MHDAHVRRAHCPLSLSLKSPLLCSCADWPRAEREDRSQSSPQRPAPFLPSRRPAPPRTPGTHLFLSTSYLLHLTVSSQQKATFPRALVGPLVGRIPRHVPDPCFHPCFHPCFYAGFVTLPLLADPTTLAKPCQRCMQKSKAMKRKESK